MDDVHHSQRWNELCKFLYGPETLTKPLPEVVEHIQTLIVGIQQMQALQPGGEIAAENDLLRGQLGEWKTRAESAETLLQSLDEDDNALSPDGGKARLVAENQQLRITLEEAQRATVDAPAKHDLNDCAMAMFAQLDEGVQDWAMEICRQDHIEPWQMVSGHLALAQERGELSSPVLDPGWMEQGQKFQRAYTCGGCGKTQEGRVGQKFCGNACAKIAADRERPKQAVSDAELERGVQRPGSTRTPIRRQGAML